MLRKLLILTAFLIVLLTVSTANADPPGPTAPAVRLEGGACAAWHLAFRYEGTTSVWQYSNGATGHATTKCKLSLVSGTPQYTYGQSVVDGCVWTLSLEGEKGMLTTQCFGEWSP